jgi:hypothetical protein
MHDRQHRCWHGNGLHWTAAHRFALSCNRPVGVSEPVQKKELLRKCMLTATLGLRAKPALWLNKTTSFISEVTNCWNKRYKPHGALPALPNPQHTSFSTSTRLALNSIKSVRIAHFLKFRPRDRVKSWNPLRWFRGVKNR